MSEKPVAPVVGKLGGHDLVCWDCHAVWIPVYGTRCSKHGTPEELASARQQADAAIASLGHWKRPSYLPPRPAPPSVEDKDGSVKIDASPTRLELQRGLLVELGPEPRWWRIFARRRWRERQRRILAMDVSVLADYYARHYNGPMLEKLRGARPIDFAGLKKAKGD